MLSPAWSTDMITESGWAALERTGIAAPGRPARRPARAARTAAADAGAADQPVRLDAVPGLWSCRSCLEPFNAIKKL